MLIGLNFMGENFGDSEYGYFTYAGITPKTVSDPQILDLYEKGDYAAIYGLGHAMGERSSADAYFALGTLYQLGLGVKKNPKEASRWFEKAAFQDHAPAQYNLGVNYIEQNSDTKLIEAGANWIKIAARQGLVEAVFAMSVLYHHGVGVEKNEAEHAKWLEMAIAKDYARSHTFMADLLCKENMPTGKDDFKLLADVVTYWYEKGAKGGDSLAQTRLASMYYGGEASQIDYPKAYELSTLASAKGVPEALHIRSRLLRSGLGCEKDEAEAEKCVRQAAWKGYAPAQFDLGQAYAEGLLGLEQDYAMGMAWLQKAAVKGNRDALRLIGKLCLGGHGGENGNFLAMLCVEKAASLGDAESQFLLGKMYASGLGVRPNRNNAMYWLENSANQGNEDAREMLDRLREDRL